VVANSVLLALIKKIGSAITAMFALNACAGARDEYPTRPPIGWIDFCAENPRECIASTPQQRDVAMTLDAWRELNILNHRVNDTIRPMSDIIHWGVIDKWSIPTDGYGDCEDYALLKRKLLIEAGWPRETLLITLVRNGRGEDHTVLTLRSDVGDLILDDENKLIVTPSQTGYSFVKRQSQSDPNAWVSLEPQGMARLLPTQE
jgi:predicted transglutaminase-like cysteine proteinase